MQRDNGGLGFRARAVAVLLFACARADLTSAQVANPGFEQAGGTLSSWTIINNVSQNVRASATTPRSGVAVAKVFGGSNGSPNYSGIYQNVPASGGQMWQASAYVRHNTGDSLAFTNRLVMKIECYRVPNGAYGSADMLSENQLEVLNAASPTNSWIACSFSAFAPAGTVSARIAFIFVQNANAAGAALIDDVSLAVIQPPPDITWDLVWSDEFDGAAIDGSKWRVEDLHLIKNNELQYYAPDEVYVQGGRVTLRSRQRGYWGFDSNGNWRHFDYTSGLIESRDRFATTYGKIEVRAKLPSTRGLWPAHWMLPDSRQWPPEIDIMELLGHEPNRVYMTHHWGTWPNVQHNGGSYTGPNFATGFHTFAVEWSPTRLDWKIDGVLRFTSTSNIPREPFYIILNTAVGGDWPGNPDGTTVFPQYHDIEFVRVYVPADPGPPSVNLVDFTPGTAVADGVIGGSEYATLTNGINAGLFDQIGHNTEMYIDSSSDGRLNIGFDSVTAWSAVSPYGVVVYVDSEPGGFASTYELADIATGSRRVASGKGASGQRSDLYFASGFRADYAIVFEPEYATVFRLDRTDHVEINGAALGAATDMHGGIEVQYRLDDGSHGGRVRECELRLAQIGVAPGGSFRFVATLVNGASAFRTNEFVGVTAGNSWDTVNPGASPVVLKPGDFGVFVTVGPGSGCGTGCNVAGGDADVDGDCDVDLEDLSRLLGGFGTTSGATHANGDTDLDGDVDLDDLAKLLSVFGTLCP